MDLFDSVVWVVGVLSELEVVNLIVVCMILEIVRLEVEGLFFEDV